MRNRRVLQIAALVALSISNTVFAQTATPIASPFTQQIQETDSTKTVHTTQAVSPKTIKKTVAKYSNPLFNPSNTLGIAYAENMIDKTSVLIKQNKLVEARNVIEPVAKWLQQATEYHTYLYRVLKEIDTAKTQADVERELALKFAVARDKASYQFALLLIEEKKLPPAVDKLVDVIRSQPNSQLGFASYEVLQQIGFTYKAVVPEEDTKGDQTINGQ